MDSWAPGRMRTGEGTEKSDMEATWMSLWRPQTCHHACCWDVEDLLTGDGWGLAAFGGDGKGLGARLFISLV